MTGNIRTSYPERDAGWIYVSVVVASFLHHNSIVTRAGKTRQSTKIITPESAPASDGPVASHTPPLTPYQRMRELLASRRTETREIATTDDLKTYLKENPNPEPLVLRMKLLWVSDHQYQQLKFARLHFIDADSPESLEELLTLFRDRYADNEHDIDSLLFTATAWNVSSGNSSIPPPGTVVRVTNYSNLSVFRDSQCQATIKLANLEWP